LAASYDQLNCLYFLGKYYELCKHEKESANLYKRTMTGTQLDFLGRTLAGSRLVARDLRPEKFLSKELTVRDDKKIGDESSGKTEEP
jgi:hypothetical protein